MDVVTYGPVEEDQALFVYMNTKYGVDPSLECYTCMVDPGSTQGN